MLHEKKGVVGWCGVNDSDKGCKIDLKMQSAPAGQMEAIVHTKTKVYKLGVMEHSGKSAEKSFYHSISAKDIIGVSVEHMSTHYIAKGGIMLKVAPKQQDKKEIVVNQNKAEDAAPNKNQMESKEHIESFESAGNIAESKESVEPVDLEDDLFESREFIEGDELAINQLENEQCLEFTEEVELGSKQFESESADYGKEDILPVRIARCEMRKCDWEWIKQQEAINLNSNENKPEKDNCEMEYGQPQNNKVMIARSEMRHCDCNSDCNCTLGGNLSDTEQPGRNEMISQMIKDDYTDNDEDKLIEMMKNADMSNTKVEHQLIGEFSGREGVLGQGVWWKVEQPGINDWHYLAGELMAKDGSRVRGIAMKAEVDYLPQHMVEYAKKIEEYYVVLIDVTTGKLLPIDAC